jgi:hypothetical protein
VKGRALTVGWIVMILVVLVALGWTVARTISLGRSGASADTQRAGLARELEASRQNIQAELVANADLLRDIRWSPDRATAADVLRRLADLARGGQAKVLAIAPLEQEPAARYRKSSHRIDMTASFSELLDLATRVEREGGILEDVVLEVSQRKPGEGAGRDTVRAQFRLTTIEPSDDTRRIMERVLAATAKRSRSPLAVALTLPLEARAETTLLPLRDPFAFAEAPRLRVPAIAVAPAPPITPVSVKGIMKFPGGALAIVDDQVVKVGDVVKGRRVEQIVDGRIVLSEPGGGLRSILLPGFAPAPTTRR